MTSTPAFRSFRRGPRIPLEFLVDHDPNVIPIPASLSDLLPQLLLNFTSWETSTRTTATNKAPIVDAINALRQSIEPCKMYKDSFVLLLHGPIPSGSSGRAILNYLADFQYSIYHGIYDDGVFQLTCVFSTETDDSAFDTLALLHIFRVQNSSSNVLYSLTPEGFRYFGIIAADHIPPPAPPTPDLSPTLPSPGLDPGVASLVREIMTSVTSSLASSNLASQEKLQSHMASVSSSNQVNQDNLLSHLALVTAQVPDAKAATLAQADEIKGIFPSPAYFSAHFTHSDGRANLVTITSSFQSTVHQLSDIDRPFFTDESALRCALLRFYDRGSHDASLNDFRPRGSPTIATIDHFTAACSYLVKIFSAFFGSHMIAPLEHLMCAFLEAHRKYGVTYARLVPIFDRKLGSLRCSSHRVGDDPAVRVTSILALDEDDMGIIAELSRQQQLAEINAVKAEQSKTKLGTDAATRKSARLEKKNAAASDPTSAASGDKSPRPPLPTLIGTSASAPPCHNWIRGFCTTDPCPNNRPHSFDAACLPPLVQSYKQAVIKSSRPRP